MTPQQTPEHILQGIYERANTTLKKSQINDKEIRQGVDYVCRCMSNRAGVRLLMSCLLGKLINPDVDLRKPYTEIGGTDCFSGRTYDEQYLTPFINNHRLPCNSTTAFLTPALRNIDQALTSDREIIGRPRELYRTTLQLLEDVANNRITAGELFVEIVRVLLNIRDENMARMNSLINALKHTEGALPLSSEAIVSLVSQHLACKNSSRLPVLIVAAAYKSVEEFIGEKVLPLNVHNAADLQTGSMGDVEICLVGDDSIVTVYEMKMKRVTNGDIDNAIIKITKAPRRINNYIFVTTDAIEPDVREYAAKFYEETGGIEIAILDSISFLRHFLHLFHRIRVHYLNAYQNLVLSEPDSAVSRTLKEAFLALRQVAESSE
ncbi:MAG: restriction endonuclease, SacI family [Candidatus Magnetobacterium sp. LHC-1]|nr:restriction endonuclease, SacI family [Nitrospirota bacterium]